MVVEDEVDLRKEEVEKETPSWVPRRSRERCLRQQPGQ